MATDLKSPPPAGASGSFNVEELIDNDPIRAKQWIAFAVCGALALLEGFDLQIVAYTAPQIQKEWGTPKAEFGPVFSAALFGAIIGSSLIAIFSDRYGPKRMLIWSSLIFSAFTLIAAFARNVVDLVILRAIAGIGIGGAAPGIVVIVAALAPRRVRATAITSILSAVLIGSVVGGAICSQAIPAFGWRPVFLVGGALPLLLLPFAILVLTEPLTYLVRRKAPGPRISAELRRLGKPVHDRDKYTANAEAVAKSSVRDLFSPKYRLATGFLLTSSLLGGCFYYLLVNWLPTILHDSGASLGTAIMATVTLNLGGIVGALVQGRLMDRLNPYLVIASGYLIGAIAIFSIGGFPASSTIGLIFLVGCFALGGQTCKVAIPPLFYPAELSSAGLGTTVALARVGGVIGPLVGSAIVLWGGGAREMYWAAGIMTLAVSACLCSVYQIARHR